MSNSQCSAEFTQAAIALKTSLTVPVSDRRKLCKIIAAYHPCPVPSPFRVDQSWDVMINRFVAMHPAGHCRNDLTAKDLSLLVAERTDFTTKPYKR
ncbi:Hypothetical protein CINCED_3A021468 [Cinara cedri]|uniref:Uncharacterized protein n=1 Tax=Cinara cedri TaxID=506608 RepID=A0A5E4NRC0_9HEMI|nr:Hypothetical protein CINCED_3A021468 [Cinara cedri]